jgi:hypothetical protein
MRGIVTCVLAVMIAAPLLGGQRRLGHDPLTPGEVDQLRDTAVEPNHRIKLYVEFARRRMTSVDQVIADPKAKDRGAQLHDLLQDFATLMDEIGDNLDMYNEQQWDVRKSLKLVIEGDSEFQLKLRKLADLNNDPKLSAEADQYKFVLQDAQESLNNNADDARHIMQDQNELAKNKKLKKEDQPVGHKVDPTNVPHN